MYRGFHGCISLEDFLFLQSKMLRATVLWRKKKKKGWAALERHFRGIHGVFQRRTKNNLWHSSLIQPATFYSSASFLPSSLFAVDLQVKRLTSPGQTLTRWVSPWAHKDPVTLCILFSLSYTLNLCFQLCLLSQPLSLSPFGIPVSPSVRSLFPSLPHCPAVSIMAWVIDFCKGWLQLPLSFLFSLILSLFFPLYLSLSAPPPSLLLLLFATLFPSVALFLSCSVPPLSGRHNIRQKTPDAVSLHVYIWFSHSHSTLTWPGNNL